MSSIGRRAALGLLASGGAAGAQTAPVQTIPGLENFSIERPRPTPLPTPSPTAAATPVPVPPGSPVLVVPSIRPTPRLALPPVPRAIPSPRPLPSATPEPLPTPSASPTPEPSPTPIATPTRVAPAEAPPIAPREEGGAIWPWLLGAVLVALGLVAAFLLGRRRPAQPRAVEEALPIAPPPPPALKQPAPVAPPVTPRLAITLRPVRAGLNLLSATAECEVVVANTGDRPATDIRMGLRLLSAGIGQEADLAAVFAEPVARPVAPPFTLQPGEERRMRGIAALPRDAIRPMTAAGRPMFVPLVAVNLLYALDGTPAQTGQAFAIGVERADSAKLAPLWLDAPPRMHDAVGARPHTVAVER